MNNGIQRRILSLVLLICMLLSCMSSVLAIAADGELTQVDGYYLIYTADDLMAYNNIVNGGSWTNSQNAKLMADIDLKGCDWTPIGLYSDHGEGKGSFSGKTFDGNGHVVSNVNVVVNSRCETGFFSRLDGGAVVKNLGIVNATIVNNAGIRSGIVCGDIVGATVENVFTDGTVITSHTQAGGISGEIANGATLKNCYTSCDNVVQNIVGNNTLSNVFYVGAEDTDVYDWTSVIIDKAMLKTGEAAYVMNQKIGSTVWYQNLDNGSDVDVWPVGVNSHGIVYEVNETLCPLVFDTKVVYSNKDENKVSAMHTFEDGTCVHCGKAIGAEDIADLRKVSLNKIKAYVDLDLYREAQVAEINTIFDEAAADLEECTTQPDMDAIIVDAQSKLDAVKTNDEISREELRPTADAKVQELHNSVDFNAYRAAQVDAINVIIDNFSEDVYEATTKAKINSLCEVALSRINLLPTDEYYNTAIATLEGVLTEELLDLYYHGQQLELKSAVANGIVAINASESIEAVDIAVENAKLAINTIKTAEQIDFNNAFSDMPDGLLAYDGFIGNVGAIEGQSTGIGFYNLFDFEGGKENIQISMESPLTYDNLLSSPKYFTYVTSAYRSGRSFAPWGDSSFDKAGVASDGLIGVNGNGKPVYMSWLMRTNGRGTNALEFHQTNGFWHGGSRRFAVGSFNAGDGIESSSVDDKNYWSLRIGPDGGDKNEIIRTNKEFDSEETVLVVLKLEFNYPNDSKISMYLNPDVTEDLPVEADAVATTKKDIRFRGMTNHAESQFSMDELRVGTSYRAVAPLSEEALPSPTAEVTLSPTLKPTFLATTKPSAIATLEPPEKPVEEPTLTASPIEVPTQTPTVTPTMDSTEIPVVPTETPVEDELTKAKEEAKATLDSYININNYEETEKVLLTELISEAKAAIDACPSISEVEATLAVFKLVIDGVPTVDELTEQLDIKVKKIKFIKKKIKVKVGKKVILKVKLTPEKLQKSAKRVKWSIDKKGKKVVKFVSNVKKLNGKLKAKIKAVKKGKAKVTCKAPSGKKAVCTIVVNQK